MGRKAPLAAERLEASIDRTRLLTIVAQDPSVRVAGAPLLGRVAVPVEPLSPGPRGYRVEVIDYDASADSLYLPNGRRALDGSTRGDPFEGVPVADLLDDPAFHAQNVYAIVMRVLSRFEHALGRRVGWGFPGHQLKVAPHAFSDANAFYSGRDQALLFGYIRRGGAPPVHLCLSHDVVAHEAVHALLDGLRRRYTSPSSPDQAAFHEAFADIVALLSVFGLREVVGAVLDLRLSQAFAGGSRDGRFVRRRDVTLERLRRSVLLGLAEEMGQEVASTRGVPLRRSAELTPSTGYLRLPEFREAHRRGEVLVAAVMSSFLSVWKRRLDTLGEARPGLLHRDRVVEEGADVADALLTMAIRSIDYLPPVHLEFGDFLSALLTADCEVRPEDGRYAFREVLRETFASYGIRPATRSSGREAGTWQPPSGRLVYDGSHHESLSRDPDEVFRFVWQNRRALRLDGSAYTRVLSVRPCMRVAPDGFALRETVAEVVQLLDVAASELLGLGIRVPRGMPSSTRVRLEGGMTLIFDDFGRLKYAISNSVRNAKRQSARLASLWERGAFDEGAAGGRGFARAHRLRAWGRPAYAAERW